MKKLLMAAVVAVLASCASHDESHQIGMANPASVHCLNLGGKLDIERGLGGNAGYCTLPSGERIEEWSLYLRDNRK